MSPVQRIAAATLATLITLVCVAMAVAAAFERSGTALDRVLLATLAALLVGGVHLLPALAGARSRTSQPLAWALWVGCLLATLYGHAHFLGAASARAGAQRAQSVAPTEHAAALQAELAAITARPLASVAQALAAAQGKAAQAAAALRRCEAAATRCPAAAATLASLQAQAQALAIERAQAERAAELRTLLAQAAQGQTQARNAVAVDPVDAELAGWLGLPAPTVGLLAALAQSLLAELLAALLWRMALASAEQVPAGAEGRATSAKTNPVPTLPPTPGTAASTAKSNAEPGLPNLPACSISQVDTRQRDPPRKATQPVLSPRNH